MSEDEPIQLGPLRFDPRTGELASDRGSEILPVKVAALLMTLHNANGAMLSREQLLDQCWGQGNGSDEGLTQAVAYLRRALGRLGSDSDMLKTYPKRGYALKRTVPIDENESNNRGRGPGSRA